MGSLSGNGSIWGFNPFHSHNESRRRRRNKSSRESKSSNSSDSTSTGGPGNRFPLKQAVTAASLSLTGDTIAQLRQRWLKNKDTISDSQNPQDMIKSLVTEHDWFRAARMTSYGFLFYGPGSYAWYQFLDKCMPKQNILNVSTKVLLNQIVLGPAVIAVVFAWNNLWLGKMSELPNRYKKDALSTLLFGFRFWIPVSVLNFWVVPLQARVAFMSTNAIFWNYYLSSTMNK